jgi:hypothetical protein
MYIGLYINFNSTGDLLTVFSDLITECRLPRCDKLTPPALTKQKYIMSSHLTIIQSVIDY